MTNAKKLIKRYDKEEKKAILEALLDEAVPAEVEPPGVIPLADVFDKAKELRQNGDALVGLSTGFTSIDRLTKGIAPGDLTIIYGDTSHGKSQLSQNISYNLAKAGHGVLYCGLEMTSEQCTNRFMSIASDPEAVRWLPIFYPSKYLDTKDIDGVITQGIKQGAELVVIDQLQDFPHDSNNAANEISMVTLAIKRAAVEHNIPIILISHINRSGAKSGPPTLQELKGSSSIEQRADICLALWRDMDADDGLLHVRLRKNRNRGMQYTSATLAVQDEVRLVERLTEGISSVFPGAIVV